MATGKDTAIPDLSTSWEGYQFNRVEELIKKWLKAHQNEKIGWVVKEKGDGGETTVTFYASEYDYNLYVSDPTTYESKLLGKFTFVDASEAASEYTLSARVVSTPSLVQIAGESNTITIHYASYWGADTTDIETEAGKITVSINNAIVSALTQKANDREGGGGQDYTIDFGSYITQETNTVVVKVQNAAGQSRSWTYTIESKSLSLSLGTSYTAQESIAKGSNWALPIQVGGVGGTVRIRVDDGELDYSHSVSGGSSYTFYIDAYDTLSTGVHKVTIDCTDSTYGLSTETMTIYFIKKGGGNAIAIGSGAPNSVTMYGTIQVPYFFYAPNNNEGDTVQVGIKLYDTNGELVATMQNQTVEVNSDHSSGIKYASASITDNSLKGTTAKLEISLGAASVQHSFEITDAGVTIEEASECIVHYAFAGKSNDDADVDSMTSSYNGSQTSRLVRSSNFKLKSNNGFDGTGFLIPSGKTVTLKDWLPFGVDCGANGNQTGRTIEFEFEIGICSDTETPVISCMDEDSCGFCVYPNRIEVKYQTSSNKILQFIPDDKRLKFSLVINGTKTTCVNDDGNGNTESKDRNLAFLFINGVATRIFAYEESSWLQETIKEIVFGSTGCELTLYSIRCYEKSLTIKEIMGNFAYDTPNIEDKLAIAKRNAILQSDGKTIDVSKIATARPNTPIITWWMEKLPTNKKDPQTCSATYFENPWWSEEEYGHACAPFTAGSHEINGDGTSSNSYPLPYKNWAEKFSSITLHLESEDVNVTKYSITKGLEDKETKYVHKVNFASSEGLLNITAMNMFQQILLSIYGSYSDLLTRYQQEQADAGEDIIFRKSLSGFPEIGLRMLTDNGQTVTRFLSIYNFINNKKSEYLFGFKKDYTKNQIWEVEENRNFFNTYMPNHKVVGETYTASQITCGSADLYYARVPSSSPVYTDNDLGVITSQQQVTQGNKEIAVLRRFHNWVVSVNPNVAGRYYAQYGYYRPFTLQEDGFTSKTLGTVTFTRDTKEYRRQKFLAEYGDYLVLSDAMFYFLFCTWILGMDSLDKNMSIAFDDVEEFYSDGSSCDAAIADNEAGVLHKPKARFMLRDTDTWGLFNNSGVLTFRYWIEWNDTYNVTTGETGEITGESYNEETKTYDIESSVEGASPVFNGRMSGIWDVIYQTVESQLAAMYTSMRNGGLNATDMFAKYKEFWSEWCEALYNVDAMGYANTGNFTMAYGDKMAHMEYFLKMRERYMDSKYGYGNTAKRVTLRMSSVPEGVWMKHYCPIYASFVYGGGEATTQRNLNAGTMAYLPCEATAFNDATSYINDADLVTHIGTYTTDAGGEKKTAGLEGLGKFAFTLGFNRFTRLQEFIMAYTADNPNETQQNYGITTDYIDFSSLLMLRKVVMTYVKGFTTPIVIGSDLVEYIDFTGTPTTSITVPATDTLTYIAYPNTITSLVLDGQDSLTEDGLVCAGVANLRKVSITNCPNLDTYALVQRLASTNTVLESLTLDNVNWENCSKVVLDYLLSIKNCDLTGSITMGGTGQNRITFTQKLQILKKWGNVDAEDAKLKLSYILISLYSCSVLGEQYLSKEGDYQFTLGNPYAASGVATQNANNMTGVKWSLSNEDNATVDADTGILHVHTVGLEENEPKATLTATITTTDGTITAQMEIGFYYRSCKLGDYVYADGTFGPAERSDKTTIGRCFYINPTDPNDRRMISLANQNDSMVWGLYPDSNGTNGFPSADVKLASDPTYNCFDTPVENITSSSATISESTFRDASDAGDNGFKVFASTNMWGDGISNKTTANTGKKTLTEALAAMLTGYSAGDEVPVGLYKTLQIIAHRNKILSDDNFSDSYEIPVASKSETEMEALVRILASITSSKGSLYRQFEFPAASYCYAYQPTTLKDGEVLADKFKAHHWYLPTAGELARLYWYKKLATSDDEKKVLDGVSMSTSSTHWSSTEYGSFNAWYVHFGNGSTTYSNKCNTLVVRAVAAF